MRDAWVTSVLTRGPGHPFRETRSRTKSLIEFRRRLSLISDVLISRRFGLTRLEQIPSRSQEDYEGQNLRRRLKGVTGEFPVRGLRGKPLRLTVMGGIGILGAREFRACTNRCTRFSNSTRRTRMANRCDPLAQLGRATDS